MDLSLPAEHVDLQRKTRAFIADKILPLENDPRCTAHGPDADLRRELIALAKGAGLLAAHMPRELGGLGLDHVGKAVVFEEAGYSPLGPVAMNIAAPDEATGSGSGL